MSLQQMGDFGNVDCMHESPALASRRLGASVRLRLVGRLRGVVEDVIDSQSFCERGVFDPVAVRRALDDTIEARRDGAYLILSIVLVELWLRKFVAQKRPSSRLAIADRLEGKAKTFL
jgi:hypothetical protein